MSRCFNILKVSGRHHACMIFPGSLMTLHGAVRHTLTLWRFPHPITCHGVYTFLALCPRVYMYVVMFRAEDWSFSGSLLCSYMYLAKIKVFELGAV